MVSAVVVVTANHWIFDAVTGAAVAAVAAVAAQTVFARVAAADMGVGPESGAGRTGPRRIGCAAAWPHATIRRSSATV